MNSVDPLSLEDSFGPNSTGASDLEAGWFSESQSAVQSKVQQFPGIAIGAAVAAGVMIGWLVKRL